MADMRRFFLVAVFLALPPLALAESLFLSALAERGFVRVAAPTEEGRAEIPIDNIPVQETKWYSVCRADGTVEIVVDDRCRQQESISYTTGGFVYTGEDRGEWGGGLRVERPDGTVSKLIEENVRAIVSYAPASYNPRGPDRWVTGASRLYVFTGLAHLGESAGAIWEVTDPAGEPIARRLTLLPDAPEIVLEGANANEQMRFLVIGYGSVVVYDPNYDLLMVPLVNQPWAFRGPISAISQPGPRVNEILLGFRNHVALIELWDRNGEAKFFRRAGSN